MNEADMLPHIIQCPFNEALNPTRHKKNENTEKTHHSNSKMSKIGRDLIW